MPNPNKPENKDLEFKNFVIDFKKIGDEAGVAEGYLAVYGNVDLGYDRILQGAFKEHLEQNGNNVPFLADHNSTKQIGAMSVVEDSFGLYAKMTYYLDTPKGLEKYNIAINNKKHGLKTGLSIGYSVESASYVIEDDKEIRNLVKLGLWEGSQVTFPMNPAAGISTVKSEISAKNIEHCLRDVGVSISKAKKYANLIHNDLRDVDQNELDLLETIKTFKQALKA